MTVYLPLLSFRLTFAQEIPEVKCSTINFKPIQLNTPLIELLHVEKMCDFLMMVCTNNPQ